MDIVCISSGLERFHYHWWRGVPLVRGLADLLEKAGELFYHTSAKRGYYARQSSIRTEEWSYLLNIGSDRRPPELYNRKRDLAEQDNVLDAHRDVADELELRLRRFADEVS
jgi:hypothetical protein